MKYPVLLNEVCFVTCEFIDYKNEFQDTEHILTVIDR